MSESPLESGASRYIRLVTFRRDGREVATPVWPVSFEGRLFFGTTHATGKFKRLRRDPRVRYAACNARGSRLLGPWREGTARLVEDLAFRRRLEAALIAKYGWVYRLIMVIYRLRGWYQKRVLYEILPAGD